MQGKKTSKYGVGRSSRVQTSRPQTWISEQEAALGCIFFNHAGRSTFCSRSHHYTGTLLLAKDVAAMDLYSICRKSMVAAVQEQRPDNGTVTRTLSLHMLLPTESKGHNLIQYDKKENLEVFTDSKDWITTYFLDHCHGSPLVLTKWQ